MEHRTSRRPRTSKGQTCILVIDLPITSTYGGHLQCAVCRLIDVMCTGDLVRGVLSIARHTQVRPSATVWHRQPTESSMGVTNISSDFLWGNRALCCISCEGRWLHIPPPNICNTLDCFLEFCSVEYLLRPYFSFNATRNETTQCIRPLFVNTWCKARRVDQQLSLGPREQRGDKFFGSC